MPDVPQPSPGHPVFGPEGTRTDHFPRSIDLPPGADTPSFDEYRWSQLVEENKRIISVLGALKGRLDELQAFDLAGALDALNRRLTEAEAQANLVAQLEGKMTALVMRLDLHTERHREVVGRVEALEAKDAPPAKPVDETNAKIVEFLNSAPDVKFTAITIRENLGIPAKYIHDRCKTLVRQGLIRTHVAEGRHPFYQALERKAEPVDGQPV
jgi:hypothetical protein